MVSDPSLLPVRVMVVDDSAIIRGLLIRVLEEIPGIEVVGTAANGRLALEQAALLRPDIVLLDIEMPEMDGLGALPGLLKCSPPPHVIMVSTLTAQNAEISLKALALGASDYIAKPSSMKDAKDDNEAQQFYRDLVRKIQALAPREARASARRLLQAEPVRYPAHPVHALAIGCSTGGPQALATIFGGLATAFPLVPVFITQHMPPTFTRILAQHLAELCRRPCAEGVNGEEVKPGSVYVAPGDHHMVPEKLHRKVVIRLNQLPPVNFCRPAVDPMLEALVRIYGRNLLTVILTGMGSDGVSGARAAVAAGGTVVAQDEASSVVWGMPRAVADARIASAILPIANIAPYIRKACL